MPADYIITGALSPLARHIIARLNMRQCRVVGIDRPEAVAAGQTDLPLYAADIRDSDALREIFQTEAREYTVVIHCAAHSAAPDAALSAVHDSGMETILDLCREQAVRRLVYVGSTLALAGPSNALIHEPDFFRPDSARTRRGQALAASCAAVAEAADEGMDCVIALPGEFVAPADATDTLPLNRLIRALTQKKIRFGVGGGLDLVDIRDAAQGVLLAADKGVSGRCYILSGQYMPLRELFTLVRESAGTARVAIFPLALARLLLPLSEVWDGEKPLYNAHSLDVLSARFHFSHERADRELGYAPRSVRETVAAAARFEAACAPKAPQPCLPPVAECAK